MSIKVRLLLSNFAMIIIPTILIYILSAVFWVYNTKPIEQASESKIESNPIMRILQSNNKVVRDINIQLLKNPDGILESSTSKEYEEYLKYVYSGLIVRKDDSIVYSSQVLKEYDLENKLPKFGEKIDKRSYFKNGRYENLILYEQYDFYFKDKSEGSVFIINDHDYALRTMKRYGTFVCISSIIVLILTGGILTILMYKKITKPLNILKVAANDIKEGNLENKIEIDSKDEFGQVCGAFEEMRYRLKDSLEKQIKYEENRKELISNISHDLKTPITTIKGYIEGIRDGVAGSKEKMDKYINTINNKASYMDNLIDELFLYSKLDLNRLPFDFQKINITEYLKDLLEEIKFDMVKSNIKFEYQMKNKPIMVKVDADKIKRVISNIVNNSVKYMDKENSSINVTLFDEKRFVRIEIEDNGRGISKEELPYVFDRFYRADPSRNTSTGGSGLGLAIAKGIVEEHGGMIWVESEVGIGTKIIFTLKKSGI